MAIMGQNPNITTRTATSKEICSWVRRGLNFPVDFQRRQSTTPINAENVKYKRGNLITIEIRNAPSKERNITNALIVSAAVIFDLSLS